MLPAKCQSVTQQRLKPQVSDLSWAPWKNSFFFPKLEGEDDDRQHSRAGRAAFECCSVSVSWRQYLTTATHLSARQQQPVPAILVPHRGQGLTSFRSSPQSSCYSTSAHCLSVTRGHALPSLPLLCRQWQNILPIGVLFTSKRLFTLTCVHFCCLIQAMSHILVTPVLAHSSKWIFCLYH